MIIYMYILYIWLTIADILSLFTVYTLIYLDVIVHFIFLTVCGRRRRRGMKMMDVTTTTTKHTLKSVFSSFTVHLHKDV